VQRKLPPFLEWLIHPRDGIGYLFIGTRLFRVVECFGAVRLEGADDVTYAAIVAGGPELPPPGVSLDRHFNDYVRGLVGFLFGRRMYEVMRYWDEDQPEWEVVEHDFAALWRAQPKWVVSRSLKSVGANATLVAGDVEAFVRRLKAEVEGEIDVAGPELAGCLTDLGLIDEYRLYFRPFVLGRGKPYFAGARPPLRLIAADPVGEDAVRLTCVPT
jgi:dihydrofolate reductase